MERKHEGRLFESLYFESIFREAAEAALSDREDRERNRDGRSINYQDSAKNPQVRKYGCYLYSLIKGARRNPKLADDKYDEYVRNGMMESDCTIRDPAGILHDLTGHAYTGRKSSSYDPDADIAIAKWVNGSHEHFVLMKNEKEVKWDSIGLSNTATNGKVDSWRLFYDTSKKAV